MLSKFSQCSDLFLILSLVGRPLSIKFCDLRSSDSCRMNWCCWWCCWCIKIAPPCEINWYCVGGIIAPINPCAPPPRVEYCDIALLYACDFKFSIVANVGLSEIGVMIGIGNVTEVDAYEMVIDKRSLQFDFCVILVLLVGSSCTNDVDSWRLFSGRFECRKIAVGFLF